MFGPKKIQIFFLLYFSFLFHYLHVFLSGLCIVFLANISF